MLKDLNRKMHKTEKNAAGRGTAPPNSFHYITFNITYDKITPQPFAGFKNKKTTAYWIQYEYAIAIGGSCGDKPSLQFNGLTVRMNLIRKVKTFPA